MSFRDQRVASLFKRVIADYLHEYEGSGLIITLTDIRVSPDLKYATVGLSIFPDDQANTLIEELNSKKKEVHKRIVDHTRLSRIPEVRFEIDKGEIIRKRLEELY